MKHEGLSNDMGLFLQKVNITRDYLVSAGGQGRRARRHADLHTLTVGTSSWWGACQRHEAAVVD